MSKEYQQILNGAMTLPQGEQFALVQALLSRIKESVEITDEGTRMPWETDQFFKELDRRVDDVRSGKVKAIPGEEVMEKLKKRMS